MLGAEREQRDLRILLAWASNCVVLKQRFEEKTDNIVARYARYLDACCAGPVYALHARQ